MDVLVTGASRGIGLELVRTYAARGDRAFAACREPGRADLPDGVRPVRLEVDDEASIEEAYGVAAAATAGLDLLVNNAGILDPHPVAPERRDSLQALGDLTFDDAIAVLRVNSIGPLMVAQRFMPLLRRGARLVNISSNAGSLSDKTSGGWYAYCASKAALNMVTRGLAADLADRGVIVVSVHPGWVRTDMGTAAADLPVEEAVSALVETVDRLGPEATGCFLDSDGSIHPW